MDEIMKKYIDKIFELGFGKTYNFEPFTKIIDYEKLLSCENNTFHAYTNTYTCNFLLK